jgi:mannose-6-phosphate isomerase-like protein (cupin superfamily)
LVSEQKPKGAGEPWKKKQKFSNTSGRNSTASRSPADVCIDLMRVHAGVKSGGENNLHTHTGEDAFWLVLNGAVKFYGEGNQVIADLKKTEGILIPRGFKYWFESASDEPLEIIRVAARDQNTENKRVNMAALKPWMMESNRFES